MGVFAEHSPMLDDISGGPNWNKLTSGLLKIYKAEFLEKGIVLGVYCWLSCEDKLYKKDGSTSVLARISS
ncbi:hypothetical protein ACSQ67_022857 [Phaseolus vulgaris]